MLVDILINNTATVEPLGATAAVPGRVASPTATWIFTGLSVCSVTASTIGLKIGRRQPIGPTTVGSDAGMLSKVPR